MNSRSILTILFSVIAPLIALAAYKTQPQLVATPKNAYPVRFGYISRITEWWPPQKLAAGMGIPGYTDQKIYNYISLGQWKCGDLPINAASVWSNPVNYFGSDSSFGQTDAQIRANIHKLYNSAKVEVLVTAFGSSELPTSSGYNAVDCAQKLGSFVLGNNLDGCDISWQDTSALKSGSGENWIISFQSHLRKLLPNHTIVHSPFAGYFKEDLYPNHGYTAVNAKVGSGINFYNVKYFNQGTSKYDNYEGLFNLATGIYNGTAVNQLIAKGIDKKKIVISKPASPSDTDGSGWMDAIQLGRCLSTAYDTMDWFAGAAIWQYSSDFRGKAMSSAAGHLKQLCGLSKTCK